MTALHVREGQEVRKSDPLAAVDTGMLFRAPFAGTVTRIYCERGEVVMPGVMVLTVMDSRKNTSSFPGPELRPSREEGT